MLSFVMVTHNEGRTLDNALQGVQMAMAPTDHLIAIDAGSTDRTVARLMEFAERAPCTILQLDIQDVSHSEALTLALDATQTDYVMWLGPRDHLQPHALHALRQELQATSPDLAVINSGWWYATPDHAWPRADAAWAAALPQDASRPSLLTLCPDPRRLVMARAAQAHLRPILAQALSLPALYVTLVAAATTPTFVTNPAMLHMLGTTDPAAQLETLGQHLPTEDQDARQMISLWADDTIERTAPEQAPALCTQLQALWQDVPSHLRNPLKAHNGPSGALFAALDQGDIRDAILHFTLSALARQQQQSTHLATAYAHLQHSVQAALPGPDYLRRLYDRARNI